MIQFFPASWGSAVDSIVLYQGSEDSILVTYHPKEKILGLYWPLLPAPVVSKNTAVEELLIALAVIANTGNLPKKMSRTNRARYLDSTSVVRCKCGAVLVAHPPAPEGVKND